MTIGEFGTASPTWKLTTRDNILRVMSDGLDKAIPVFLDERQADDIRRLTTGLSARLVEVTMFGRNVKLHLVGKRVAAHEWAGVAAEYCDSEAVAHNLMQILSLSEQVVSDVNSITVVLNRRGVIHRFNALAEESTGKREIDVIGLTAQELFMSESDAGLSLRNIDRFFEEGVATDVDRTIETLGGPRLYQFRNRLTPIIGLTGERLLVCSGIDVTDDRKRSRDAMKMAIWAQELNSKEHALLSELYALGTLMRGVAAGFSAGTDPAVSSENIKCLAMLVEQHAGRLDEYLAERRRMEFCQRPSANDAATSDRETLPPRRLPASM
ncbi:hypothetical protein WK76_24840 [Burkholderia ubonensis]|uniref:hypothetical protein n=1 Tax=Burkholderia ubonensis TaxID=101571 RepID=UPI00075763F6|nr:hypothetical protein [Burkholderia ubonensis]KVU84260.1 hypothetical protein WK76_24840 [Burkholderia ubonensis]